MAGRRPLDRLRCHIALRFWRQRVQIIPERLQRRMDPAVSGSQGDKRVKFQPKIGLADQPCHAINDVVGLDPNVILHRSFAHGSGQRHEERDWGLMSRRHHACIVQCSISP